MGALNDNTSLARIRAVGFEKENGFWKYDAGDGIVFLLEKLKSGLWRCMASKPNAKGTASTRLAGATAESPSNAFADAVKFAGLAMVAERGMLYKKADACDRRIETLADLKRRTDQWG